MQYSWYCSSQAHMVNVQVSSAGECFDCACMKGLSNTRQVTLQKCLMQHSRCADAAAVAFECWHQPMYLCLLAAWLEGLAWDRNCCS